MRFVLVRPRDPNNIGAVARLMANFGFDDLVVVDPWEPTWRESKAAIGASHVLETARVVPTLDEAIGDRTYVMATTAATRRRLTQSLDPRHAVERMAERGIDASRAAILFGNEKHGLSAQELDRAHSVVVIPTSSRQPSMNLSHAVAIMAWEVANAVGLASEAPPRSVIRARSESHATVDDVERLVKQATDACDGGIELPRREAAAERLRRILLRAELSSADVRLLFALLNIASDNDLSRKRE